MSATGSAMWGVASGKASEHVEAKISSKAQTRSVCVLGSALLVVQWVTLFLGIIDLPTHSFLCTTNASADILQFGGTEWHGQRDPLPGWWPGLCLTEEQLWCRANHNQHIDCATADCRAEEIRLTRWARDQQGAPIARAGGLNLSSIAAIRASVRHQYDKGCFDAIWADLERLNQNRGWVGWPGGDSFCGPCVPDGDKRSPYLPYCDDAAAKCRGLYYRPPFPRPMHYTYDCTHEQRNQTCPRLVAGSVLSVSSPSPPPPPLSPP